MCMVGSGGRSEIEESRAFRADNRSFNNHDTQELTNLTPETSQRRHSMDERFEQVFQLDLRNVSPEYQQPTAPYCVHRRIMKGINDATQIRAHRFSPFADLEKATLPPATLDWYSELEWATQTLDAFGMVDRGQISFDDGIPFSESSPSKLATMVHVHLDWHSELMLATQTLDAFCMVDRGQIIHDETSE